MYEVTQEALLNFISDKIGKFKLIKFKKEINNLSNAATYDMREEHLIVKYYIVKPTISKSNSIITLIPTKIIMSVYWIANSTERLLDNFYWYIPISLKERNQLLIDSGIKSNKSIKDSDWKYDKKIKSISNKKLVYKIYISKEE